MGVSVTDEQLRAAEQFDHETLNELARRAEAMPAVSNADLARHLTLAHEVYCYYISENTDYLEAAVKEASKRLAAEPVAP